MEDSEQAEFGAEGEGMTEVIVSLFCIAAGSLLIIFGSSMISLLRDDGPYKIAVYLLPVLGVSLLSGCALLVFFGQVKPASSLEDDCQVAVNVAYKDAQALLVRGTCFGVQPDGTVVYPRFQP